MELYLNLCRAHVPTVVRADFTRHVTDWFILLGFCECNGMALIAAHLMKRMLECMAHRDVVRGRGPRSLT